LREYPKEIYDLFLNLIESDGRVIDLGCGNGLLLRHLVRESRYKIIPYGVDFIKESIDQAKSIILPEYSDNFIVANIIDLDLKPHSFNYILFDPTNVHKDDLEKMIEKILRGVYTRG